MEWMIMPLKRYADFSGRARRKEFWMYQLFVICLYFAVFLIAGVLGVATAGPTGEPPAAINFIVGLLFLVVVFGLLIPSLAVSVRRLHDIDKSGWFLLINFIPFGGIILLVFWCQEGTRGENRFGPDPKGTGVSDVFS